MTTLRQQYIRELVLRGMSSRTQEAYVAAVYQLAKYYRKAPNQLSDEEIKNYLFYLASEKKVSASTLNQVVSAFRSFYGLVLGRPLEELRKVMPYGRREVRRARVYSITEIERLLTLGCPSQRDRVFLMTVYGGGLRLNEACHLRPQDIDSARMQIRVEQGKGKKDRYTLLSPKLLQELRNYWQAFRPSPWLFISCQQPKEPMPDGTAQRIYWRAVDRAGLPDKGGIHTLRHSFATHLLEMGVEITVVQRLLGHSSLSTTSGYLHVRQERLAQIQSPLQLIDLNRLPSP
jgi:site-specific recombinase XerD